MKILLIKKFRVFVMEFAYFFTILIKLNTSDI